ncbi:MAG: hypothetical protein NT124_04465 [Candidatus Dependentiae bacterium]|nr:hypothetical protein [Candidatus Dependentiae bacterium]
MYNNYRIGILLMAFVCVFAYGMEDISPELFCSDGQDAWCLVDTQEPAFRLIDNLMEQAKEMKKKALDAQAAYDQQKNVMFVLMRRTSPDFCCEVAASLRHNFQGTDIDPKRVYEYVGIPFNRGKYMLHDQMLSHLQKLLGVQKITEKQHRQLQYAFKTAESKEEYDAFYADTLEQLKVDEKKAESFIQKYGQIVRYGINLAEVSRVARQFDEIELASCDQADDRL